MAINTGLNNAPRASSVLSQVTTAASNLLKPAQAGVAQTITTHAWVRLRRATFTVSDLSDPKRLYDIINRFQESVLSVLGVVATNQLIPGNILRSVTFTAAQTQMLAHGLGRPWQGYFIVRAYAGAATTVLVDAPYASGVTASSILPISSSGAGTYDIYVF